MVLIHQNKGAKIILCAKRPTFWADKLKGFTVTALLQTVLQRQVASLFGWH